jgi:N-sulfoglucosamine sulfohydrolase
MLAKKIIIQLTIGLTVILTGLLAIRCQRPPDSLPNILLIVSEDHGAHLSCYGDTIIQTPHLDKIAKDGILFKNAYVTESVCSPSRSSILTGLYPHQNGHFGLATMGYHFVGDVQNVYALLKKRGYRTGMIGKLHLNPADSFPIDFHPIRESNFQKIGLSRYAQHADSFMTRSEEPFFLMVNIPEAHFPFQDVVEGKPENPVTANDVAGFPYMGFENARINAIVANYYNCFLRLDETVGKIMDRLESSGKKENTLVIYLSDHGDEMARGKFDIYEASTRIPFLVNWPGKVAKGRQSDALISTVDIVPTLLDVAGVAIPGRVSGKSLRPLFENPQAEFRNYLFTEYNCDPVFYFPRRAVRDNRYKLIYSLLDDRKNPTALHYIGNRSKAVEGSPTLEELASAPDSIRRLYQDWIQPPKIQLYDLQKDPWEFRDLSADPRFANVKERLLTALCTWQVETDDPFRFPEKLRDLTAEHDTLGTWRRKNDWQYPEYLYKNKVEAKRTGECSVTSGSDLAIGALYK